jgi:O-antigen ligase/tetratricopeptide (TPR) repeat protein
LVTALVVARPLVLGEDPGRLDRLTPASGLILSLLWFVAGAGWAVWRAWSRQRTWSGSLVEAALAAVVVLVFLSALAAAPYKHPAYLIGCEWVILLLAFCLVRDLVRTSAENRALLAAILATGVSLSAYAVYQYAYELRQNRSLIDEQAVASINREHLRQELGKQGIHLEADDPDLDVWARREKLRQELAKQDIDLSLTDPTLDNYIQRIEATNVFATFAHPNSFAGYLALLLPAIAAWAWATRSRLAAGCALLVAVALILTHSRGGILASLVVGGLIGVVQGRRWLWKRKYWILGGAALCAGVLLLVLRIPWVERGLMLTEQSAGKRTDYWIATLHLIRDHPWFGIGPGNFGRLYPRYMLPTAFEKVQAPHNFILEIWATCGVLALLALLLALSAFFWRVAQGLQLVQEPQSSAPPVSPQPPSRLWEYYVGGMVGLVLALGLRAADQPPDRILEEGIRSVVCSLLWFASFIVLDSIPWAGPGRTLALAGGVAALLLNLLVSDGISQPSVALLLWVMAALALNAGQEGRGAEASSFPRPSPLVPRPWLLVLLLGGGAVAYLVFVFLPVMTCAGSLAEARQHYGDNPDLPGWHNVREPALRKMLQEKADTREIVRAQTEADKYFRTHILHPLQEAVKRDPNDSTPHLELAAWYSEQYNLFPEESLGEKALQQIAAAQRLDPDNKDVYLAEFRIHQQMALASRTRGPEHKAAAVRAFEKAVQCDSTEARLHYQLAELLFQAEKPVPARQEAARAFELDEQSTRPERQLTGPQREQVRRWLADSPAR